jgi:hypothetical protein
MAQSPLSNTKSSSKLALYLYQPEDERQEPRRPDYTNQRLLSTGSQDQSQRSFQAPQRPATVPPSPFTTDRPLGSGQVLSLTPSFTSNLPYDNHAIGHVYPSGAGTSSSSNIRHRNHNQHIPSTTSQAIRNDSEQHDSSNWVGGLLISCIYG